MESQRRNARFAGILLLMGWSGALIFPFIAVLEGADFPLNLAAGGASLAWGALIQIFMALACSGIAVFFYPRLKEEDPALALWALVFRAIEAALTLLAAAILLLLGGLGREIAGAGPEALLALKPLGLLLRDAYHQIGGGPASLAFFLGALLYNYLFLRGGLLPRWLALWGLLGAGASILSWLLALLEISTPAIAFAVDLGAGFQELGLALYLILRGFRDPPAAARPQARPAAEAV